MNMLLPSFTILKDRWRMEKWNTWANWNWSSKMLEIKALKNSLVNQLELYYSSNDYHKIWYDLIWDFIFLFFQGNDRTYPTILKILVIYQVSDNLK